MCYLTCRELLQWSEVNKAESDVVRIFIQTIAACQKGKKQTSDILRIMIQMISTCQKVKKRTSNVISVKSKA